LKANVRDGHCRKRVDEVFREVLEVSKEISKGNAFTGPFWKTREVVVGVVVGDVRRDDVRRDSGGGRRRRGGRR
jgi:hypothetical protein